MYSKKGVVYKLHAGWFINRTPGEFTNWGRFIKFKGDSLLKIRARQMNGPRAQKKRPCSPCQAGLLSIDSNQVPGRVPVPGTSLLTGCTGSCLSPRHMHFSLYHNGLFGPSSEPGKGSLSQPALSNTRGPGPPVSDTVSLKHPAGACTERERPVSDTSLPKGAAVSDTNTMATAIDDDITFYVARRACRTRR